MKMGWIEAFGVALAIRLVAAAVMHITDCDETFNYWDPVRALYHFQFVGILLLHVVCRPMLSF